MKRNFLLSTLKMRRILVSYKILFSSVEFWINFKQSWNIFTCSSVNGWSHLACFLFIKYITIYKDRLIFKWESDGKKYTGSNMKNGKIKHLFDSSSRFQNLYYSQIKRNRREIAVFYYIGAAPDVFCCFRNYFALFSNCFLFVLRDKVLLCSTESHELIMLHRMDSSMGPFSLSLHNYGTVGGSSPSRTNEWIIWCIL